MTNAFASQFFVQTIDQFLRLLLDVNDFQITQRISQLVQFSGIRFDTIKFEGLGFARIFIEFLDLADGPFGFLIIVIQIDIHAINRIWCDTTLGSLKQSSRVIADRDLSDHEWIKFEQVGFDPVLELGREFIVGQFDNKNWILADAANVAQIGIVFFRAQFLSRVANNQIGEGLTSGILKGDLFTETFDIVLAIFDGGFDDSI